MNRALMRTLHGRVLLPVGLVLGMVGYFGAWVTHPGAAGLVITGLDLGETVKFLTIVRDGDIRLWRPGFYAPLVALSAAALLAAYRPTLAYRWWLRAPLLAVALIAAANLIPPAWTPARLLEPEFRVQTSTLVALLAGIGISPFLALLPQRLVALLITGLALAALLFPVYGLLQVLPAIAELYGRPLAPAWGPWVLATGLVILTVAYWLPSPKETAHAHRRNE